MTPAGYSFNAPPGWQVPSRDWVPPEGWRPDASWPPPPDGWEFWIRSAAAPPPPPPQAAVDAPPSGSSDAVPAFSSEPSKAVDTEVVALRQRVSELEAEAARLRNSATVELDDERILQEVGIYRYHHPLENAAEYKAELSDLSHQIKDMVKAGDAVLASDMFTFNNSLAKGRKMTAEFSKLMLRAYNAEADNCVRALRAGNVVTAKRRLESSVTAIARLGTMMEMRINPAYHALRLRELELTADYLMKLQVEKEEAREERERLREERKAAQELAAERARLDKEREHYFNALQALKASGAPAAIADLNERLQQIDNAIEQNDYRTANIRAGYVYVISNRGAFGPNIVKIGLTRRLEPMDRVRELGDASVPFPFDVHAMFFADDAVTVEADLHRAFAERRVNMINQRREFFFATPAEVRAVLLAQVGNLLEFAEEPEATQYLQSMRYWPTERAAPSGPNA
ncbi:DUF4041 domain-containing protein [Conexibacter woesei]|uniref:Helicase A859L n=1 Tax=Conexibacter woesei (strain DSM 14684 / CCUG 47730 / CIP 108061 / JCM 11494 / NBRC 100937 / ID131577) TaxID=469383 RepID=D3F0Q2_CONWI|nr:Putative helicase A859L [Conexibacter woesei DSM 14684]